MSLEIGRDDYVAVCSNVALANYGGAQFCFSVQRLEPIPMAPNMSVNLRMAKSTDRAAIHLPIPDILCQTSRMKRLTATICLTIAVLLGSTGMASALPPCPGDYDRSTWT
ncbi:MAG: hypothetical protein ACKVIF_06045, partial [Rhodospirillales bacterium]